MSDDLISNDVRERMRIDRCIWKDRELKRCMVYVIAPETTKLPSKIGISRRPLRRISGLQCSHWVRLRLFHCGYCKDDHVAAKIEATAHDILQGERLLGEWFNVAPLRAFETVEMAASILGVHFEKADEKRLDKALRPC